MIDEILQKLNLTRYQVVKKKHGNVPQITAGELIEATLKHETIPRIASCFDVSIQTINRIFKNTFPETRLTGRRTWKYFFLDIAGLKECFQCEVIKSKTEFYNSDVLLTGVQSRCKNCDTAAHHRIKDSLIKTTDLYLIDTIYANRPQGYHVDHIIPINKGGSHHQDNLCYLPASLNISKSDKMPKEVPEIMKLAIYPKFNS